MHNMPCKSTEFAPDDKYCLIKTEIPETVEKTQSGLVIGLTKTLIDGRPTTGTIVSVGKSDKYKPGDFVVFPSTDGLDFKFTDGQFLILRLESLIGKKI